MALTKEDKSRIEAEEEERYRAQVRAQLETPPVLETSQSTKPKKKRGFAWFFRNLFFLMLAFFAFVIWIGGKESERKKQEAARAAQFAQEQLTLKKKEFGEVKASLIPELTQLVERGEFDAVITKASKFAEVDESVSALIAKANSGMAARKREQELQQARVKADGLFKEGKFKETWQFAKQFDDTELKKIADGAHSKFVDTEERRLLAEVKQVASSNLERNVELYAALSELQPENKQYAGKLTQFRDKLAEQERIEYQKKNSHVQLTKWNWGQTYGYAVAEGQIKNITSESLKNVEAVVTFFDKNDNFITSDSSLIEYNPILAGQTSPFKVMARWNPEMKSARIEFKIMWGQALVTYNSSK